MSESAALTYMHAPVYARAIQGLCDEEDLQEREREREQVSQRRRRKFRSTFMIQLEVHSRNYVMRASGELNFR